MSPLKIPTVALLGAGVMLYMMRFEDSQEILPQLQQWQLRRTDHVNPSSIAFQGIDAFIGCGLSQDMIDKAATLGLPGILMLHSDNQQRIPAVLIDDRELGRIAARYLIDIGYRSLACLSLEGENHPWAEQRRQGFCEVATAFGVTVENNEESLGPLDWTRLHTQPVLDEWLQSLPLPIATFAVSDFLALVAMERCRRIGLRVPEDIAMLGVDNDMFICETAWVPISSVHTPIKMMLRRAVDLLTRAINGEDNPLTTTIKPTGIITPRRSTAPAIDDRKVAEAVRLIEDGTPQGIQTADLLKILKMTRSQLDKRFKSVMGRTPADLIRTSRLHHARELLLDTHMTPAEIAQRTGFADQPALTKAFSREFGMPPARFRRVHAV